MVNDNSIQGLLLIMTDIDLYYDSVWPSSSLFVTQRKHLQTNIQGGANSSTWRIFSCFFILQSVFNNQVEKCKREQGTGIFKKNMKMKQSESSNRFWPTFQVAKKQCRIYVHCLNWKCQHYSFRRYTAVVNAKVVVHQ